MIGYAGREVFTEQESRLFQLATLAVAHIPDDVDPDPNGVRCHEVARAVGRQLGLLVIDGRFGSVDHSWLHIMNGTKATRDRHSILDVYSVARLPVVQLVDSHFSTQMMSLYRPGEQRKDIRGSVLDKINALLDRHFRRQMTSLNKLPLVQT